MKISSLAIFLSAFALTACGSQKEFNSDALGLSFRYPEKAFVIESSIDGPFPEMKLNVIEDAAHKRVYLTQETLAFADKNTQTMSYKPATLKTLDDTMVFPGRDDSYLSVLVYHVVDVPSETALKELMHTLCSTDPATERVQDFTAFRKNEGTTYQYSIPSFTTCTIGSRLAVKYFPAREKAVWWYEGEVPKFRKNQKAIIIGGPVTDAFDAGIAESMELR